MPAFGNAVKHQKECGDRSAHVERELRHIGPDHRLHPAFERIENRERRDHAHGDALAGPKRHAHHLADRRDAHSLRDHPGGQKHARRHRPGAGVESIFQQLVCRVEFALEIARHHNYAKHHPRHDVPDHQLQKAEVADEGDSRCADDGQAGGFRGDDGNCECPPRRGSSAQKIVAKILLAPAETRSEPSDSAQVQHQDSQIDGADSHGAESVPGCGMLSARFGGCQARECPGAIFLGPVSPDDAGRAAPDEWIMREG